MRLPKKAYSFNTFLQSCENIKRTTRKSLKVITLLYEPQDNNQLGEVFKNYRFKVDSSEFGEVIELSTVRRIYEREKIVYYYLIQHPSYEEIHYLFSFNGSGDIYNTLPQVIDSAPGMYYLWLPPAYFDLLKENILGTEGSYITYFHGKRLEDSGMQECKKRPRFARDIKYKGADAQLSSDELRFEYGILPQTIEFVIPSVFRFRIHKNGVYTLFFGNVEHFLQSIVGSAIEMVIKDNKNIEKTRFEVEKKGELELLNCTEITFSLQREISFEEFEDFFKTMEKSDFSAYNIRLEEGSVIFSGNIVDEQKGNIFSVTSDGKQFTVIPKYNTSSVSLIRFYRFLIEQIDELTQIEYQS